MAVIYTWKKYNAVAGTKYVIERTGSAGSTNETLYSGGTSWQLYTSRSINETTGEISYSNLIAYYVPWSTLIATIASRPVYRAPTGFTQGHWEIPVQTPNSNGEIYIYECAAYQKTVYSQGSYISDVTSSVANAYPVSGRHSDGYWYVYDGATTVEDPVESKAITGYTTIAGVSKSLTGDGYAIIDGIHRPLTKSFICHNSVWKSLITGTEVESLPTGYIQLEYIESTGTQYIDTGFKPNGNTRAVMDHESFSVASGYPTMFGVRNSNGTCGFVCHYSAGTNLIYWYYNSNTPSLNVDNPWGRHTVDFNKNELYRDGVLIDSQTLQSFNSSLNLYLFALNYGGTLPSVHQCKMRMYSCQIYDNGTLVRNFVPCINPKGVVGLYDTVGETFYGNSGTGEFTAGEPVVSTFFPLPGEFTRTEYIESTGTQWINTGVSGSSNVGFEIDFLTSNVVGPSSTDYGTMFGAFTAASTRINLGTWNSSQVTTGGEMCWGSKTYNPYITSGTRMQVSILGTTLTTPNGVQTTSSGTFTSGVTIGLFARNNNGTADQFSKTKLYSFKLYENSILVRDFIPCINASGVAGLWDKVNGKFYGNSGSGSFVSGLTLVKDYIDITPIMTSNTAPSGYVASASSVNGSAAAYMAFDSMNTTSTSERIWHSAGGMPQWIMMQFPEAVQVDMFTITNRPDTGNAAAKGITTFSFEGSNNGSTFDSLGTYTSDGAIGVTKQYTPSSTGMYKYYRINIASAGYVYGSTQYALIEQIRFYQKNT